MTNPSDRLTNWVIEKIKREYPEDVALLVAVDGAAINGDGHGEVFDYFVPATERGNELAQTFIINGVGNDLYPRSWERTERTADLDDIATQCLGRARILYARTPEDEDRFEGIRKRLFDNLSNPDFVYKKALANLDVAMDMYRTMMFEERLYKVRGLAGYIHQFLTISVACLNGTYQKDYAKGVIGEVSAWAHLPERFLEYYGAILSASTTGELKSLAHLLISATRHFIAGYKPTNRSEASAPNYQWLADWYHELRTTLNRIYFYCRTGDADSAFRDACNMQSELDIISEEFMLGEMDLLGCFDPQRLELLASRAAEWEKCIIQTIESHGITIKDYETLDAFIAANS